VEAEEYFAISQIAYEDWFIGCDGLKGETYKAISAFFSDHLIKENKELLKEFEKTSRIYKKNKHDLPLH